MVVVQCRKWNQSCDSAGTVSLSCRQTSSIRWLLLLLLTLWAGTALVYVFLTNWHSTPAKWQRSYRTVQLLLGHSLSPEIRVWAADRFVARILVLL